MDTMDSLIISMIDCEAQKGLFKRELSIILDIDIDEILDVGLKSKIVNGVVKQYLIVNLSYTPIKKENLDKLEYSYITSTMDIVFEVGDTIL